MKKTSLLLTFLALTSVATANTPRFSDLGFRYKDGKCVNPRGEIGLNPSMFGQCSDLRGHGITGFDLSGIDFSGSRFDNADLQTTKLRNTILHGASFEGANLAGVELIGATLEKVNLKNANLLNVKLADATIRNVDFSGAKISKIDFSYADIRDSRFAGANLQGATFENGTFDGCHFNQTDFQGANLRKTVLTNTDLSQAEFGNAVMAGADLSGAVLNKAEFQKTDLTGANLTRVVAKEAIFRHAILEKAQLQEADFSLTELSYANLKDAKTSKTEFKGAFFNGRTTLPFEKGKAVEGGMIFKQNYSLLVWTVYANSTNTRVLVDRIKAEFTDQITDEELDLQDTGNVETVAAKLKTSDVFVLPATDTTSSIETFAKSFSTAILEFVNSGGVVLVFGNDQKFLNASKLLPNRITPTNATDNGGLNVTISMPSHPLAAGFGATIRTIRHAHYNSTAGDGMVVMGDKAKPLVIAHQIGKGHVVWSGYCFADANDDGGRLIKNAIQLAKK